MKRSMILASALLALATVVASDFADARRLGGGKSIGAQRQSVAPSAPPPAAAPAPTAPSGAAANPVMPAKPGATVPAKPAAAAAPAASGASRWLGPIAGIAAGLGLAALLSHFGLSEEFASLLLMALLIGGAFLLVRMLLARRTPSTSPLQYAGRAGAVGAAPTSASPSGGGPRVEPVLTPWSDHEVRPQPISPSRADGGASAAVAGPQRFPAGFDAEAFARNARQQFIALQAAHDARDRKTLANVTTPKMFAEIAADLDAPRSALPTEIVALEAHVLEVATEGRDYWASVRYTGKLREDGAVNPTDFDEVWHLTKPVDGSFGWLLAGIQQRS